MSEHSGELSSQDLYKRKTTMALVPAAVQRRRFTVDTVTEPSGMLAWGVVPLLLLLGALLECLWLALVPLLPGAEVVTTDPVQQALPGLFPWSVQLYWTTLCPQVVHWLAQVSWLDATHNGL